MKILPLIALFGAWLFAPLLQVEHPPVIKCPDGAPAGAPKEAPPAPPASTPAPTGGTMRLAAPGMAENRDDVAECGRSHEA